MITPDEMDRLTLDLPPRSPDVIQLIWPDATAPVAKEVESIFHTHTNIQIVHDDVVHHVHGTEGTPCTHGEDFFMSEMWI